jgi:hypothetical protein
VDDLVEGMIRMMNPDGFLGPVNIGNPNEFTMLELAEAVIALTILSLKMFTCLYPRRSQTTSARYYLAKRILNGYLQLNEGLIKTIAYFRSDSLKIARIWRNAVSLITLNKHNLNPYMQEPNTSTTDQNKTDRRNCRKIHCFRLI